MEKIQLVLKNNDFDKMENFSNKVAIYLPEKKSNPNYSIAEIQKAIVEKTLLKITYLDTNNNSTTRAIEPIGIIFYTNQWHLIAWCWLRENYRDFKINNITDLKLTTTLFKKEHNYSIQEYMSIF